MPISIPTYLASQFVKNATLHERKLALKNSYKIQYLFTGTFTLINSKEILSKKKK
jgi:hypothetical protein|tara:strand:+ start:1504 stop:1668 length:165 start_codon:yes stop_codon:yes gene_type:complete